MGKPKLPKVIKMDKGTYRPCRENPDEPEYESIFSEPPVKLTGYALEHWNKEGKQLADKGLLPEPSRFAFAMVSIQWKIWHEAEDALETEGLVIDTKSGSKIQNPHLGILNRAHIKYMKDIQQWGGTPASMGNVSATKNPKKKNAFGKFGKQA